MSRVRSFVVALFGFGSLVLGVSARAASADDAPNVAVVEASTGYRLTRGDELSFRFPFAPELNTVATVRPDGRLALPIAGELNVEGLTVEELTARVVRTIGSQVLRPELVVNLQRGAGQRVFVGGEVTRPGVQPLLGPLTALQAVMVAEGVKDTGQPRDAIVLRRPAAGPAEVVRVDLARLMEGAADARDVVLMPYDVVIVPRSGIANVNLWIDQYVRKVLPFSVGFGYTINRNGYVQ